MGADAQVIQSYGAEGFRIGNRLYTTAVLVLPTQTLAWNGMWEMESLLPLIPPTAIPEILLLGTGVRHTQVPASLKTALRARGIGSDSMDTGAACRTFNILLGEGRRVAAALLLPTPH